ncbi:hypothetical protein LXA00_18055, partial [Erwinia amylovora]|uniref:hypothetical protein n=1 Tax=Erwinia amylovora TaxID=552 RepID=UPI0020BED149
RNNGEKKSKTIETPKCKGKKVQTETVAVGHGEAAPTTPRNRAHTPQQTPPTHELTTSNSQKNTQLT